MQSSFRWLMPAILAAAAALASEPVGTVEDAAAFVRIEPPEIQWRNVPDSLGVQQAVLLGDPTKPGIYVVRAKFPPYTMDAPHRHPKARYVTVLEGTWYTGTGRVFDVAKAVPLRAGSVMLHPANAVHWDGSAGPAPVIVQITGEGPVDTTQVDPRQPMWRVIAH